MTRRKRQLNVALEDETREQLEKAAAQTGRTLANEIRHRVQQTFQEEREFDAVTRMLGRDIMRLAAEVDLTSEGRWYEHQTAHAAVVAAIAAWLELIKPPRGAVTALLSEPSTQQGLDDPETLGRTIARLRFRTRGSVREEIAYHIEQEKKRLQETIAGHVEQEKKRLQEKAGKPTKRPHQKGDKS